MILPFFALVLTGCIKENLDNCPSDKLSTMMIVPADLPGLDPIDPVDAVSHKVYVFDEAGVLLEIFEAQINEEFQKPWSDKGPLQVIALSAEESFTNKETGAPLQVGDKLSQGEVALERAAEPSLFDGLPLYIPPTDIFRGDLVVDPTDTKSHLLPVSRAVAAVCIRIQGLKEYLTQRDGALGTINVVLTASYNNFSVLGEPAFTSRATTLPVAFMPGSTFKTISSTEYHYVPSVGNSFNIISTQDGSPVEVLIYHNNVLINQFRQIPSNSDAAVFQPILVYNGMLNVIDINYFANLSLSVSQSSWGSVVPIEKPIGGV